VLYLKFEVHLCYYEAFEHLELLLHILRFRINHVKS